MTAPNDAPRVDAPTVVLEGVEYQRTTPPYDDTPGRWNGWYHGLSFFVALDEIVRLREANERLERENAALRERVSDYKALALQLAEARAMDADLNTIRADLARMSDAT